MSNTRIKFITPAAPAIWPQTHTPDFKFKTQFGEYHIKVRMDPADPAVSAFVAKVEAPLRELFDATLASLKAEKKGALAKEMVFSSPFKEEVDRETGDPTGMITFRAGLNAGAVRKSDGKTFVMKPKLFDKNRKELPQTLQIGNGSTVKISFTIDPFFSAAKKSVLASLRLDAVQVLVLQQGQGRSAESYGFEDEEGDDLDIGDAGSEDFAPQPDAGSNDDL